MTTTKARYIDPMLSWRRVLLAMDPLEDQAAEDLACISGVPIRTVRPYLCQFRSARLVEQNTENPKLWTRLVSRELVQQAVSQHELVTLHLKAIADAVDAFADTRGNAGLADMAFLTGAPSHG